MTKWFKYCKKVSALTLLLSIYTTVGYANQEHSWEEKASACNYHIYELKQSYRYTPNTQNATELTECLMAYSMERIDRRDFPAAEDYIVEAREIFPTSTSLASVQVKVINAQGEYDRSADLLLDLIDEIDDEYSAEGASSERVTNRSKLIALLADIRYQQGDLDRAVELYREIIQSNPENIQWQRRLQEIAGENLVEEKMKKRISSHFRLQFNNGVTHDLSDDILIVLEDAYNDVGRKFNRYPQEAVTVLIYTKQDFQTVTRSPDWAGGLYDGKIRIPLGGVTKINDLLKSIIYHEYTHVLIREIAGNRVPQWLNEGLAQVSEKSIRSISTTLAEKAGKQGKLLPISDLEGTWKGFDSNKVNLAYNQSYALIDYLEESFGEHTTTLLLERIAIGISIEKSFRGLFGYDSPDEALRAFKESL